MRSKWMVGVCLLAVLCHLAIGPAADGAVRNGGGGAASEQYYKSIKTKGVGNEGQGADISVITSLDTDPRPDMVLMAYDNPEGSNTFRYKIMWNLNRYCVADKMDENYVEVGGVGWEGQGAGIAISNLDTDPRPDMVLMAYDNPQQDNTFRYKVGWNLNSNGIADRWDNNFVEVGGVGWEGQGAGIAITSLDTDNRPDMVLMAYDNPAEDNTFRYKVGWNLNSNGIADRWDNNFVEVGGVGHEGQGAGIAISNLDTDPRPDLVLMAYDNPEESNTFRYKVGWNLNSNGIADRWDNNFVEVGGVGHEGQGAGIAISNLDTDPRPDLVLMAYDPEPGAYLGINSFRYKVAYNLNSNGVAQRLMGET